jgi:hypothetical protein
MRMFREIPRTQKVRGSVRRWSRIIIPILVIFLTGGLIAYISDRIFRVRTIEFIGEGVRITIDPKRLEKNLLFLPTSNLEYDLMIAYPELEDIRIRKKFPQTLVISASIRSAIARLGTNGHVFALDENGVVLPMNNSESSLPFIRVPIDKIEVGDTLTDPRITRALSFLSAVGETIPILSIDERDTASLRARMEKTDIFIPQDGDIQILAATLQTMILGFRIKGSLPALIDLRFDKPIVKF